MKIYNVTKQSSAEQIAKINVNDWQSLPDNMVKKLLATVLHDLELDIKIRIENGKIHCDESDEYYFHTSENYIMLVRKHINLMVETKNEILKII